MTGSVCMLRMLLSLLLVVGIATACRPPPCSAANGDANFLDPDGCCATCRPGFRCNGTHAIACVPPAETQPFALQARCRAPRVCTSGQFESKAPTSSADRECRAFSSCLVGQEFERIAPTNTSDRVCSIYRLCDFPREYEALAATPTSDRTCNKVTLCDPASQIQTLAASPTSDVTCGCKEGFMYLAMRRVCTPCYTLIPGCDICGVDLDGDISCAACIAGFQPAVSGGCVLCETSNCAECSATSVCVRCNPGFVRAVGSQNGSIACVCNLPNCNQCDSNGTCLRCNEGFELSNGTCICSAEHCEQCSGTGKCMSCRPPFTQSADGQCVCTVTNCDQCSKDGTACLVCNYPFKSTPSGECVCGLSGCELCSLTGCERCRGGGIMLVDQTCLTSDASSSSAMSANAVTAGIVVAVIGSIVIIALVVVLVLRRSRTVPKRSVDANPTYAVASHPLPPSPPPRHRPDAFEEPVYEFPTGCITNPATSEIIYDLATMGHEETIYDLATTHPIDEYISVDDDDDDKK